MTAIFAMLFSFTAFAGFQGYQSTTNLGVFNKIKCSTGMTCTKVGDKLDMVASPSITGPLTISGPLLVSGALSLSSGPVNISAPVVISGTGAVTILGNGTGVIAGFLPGLVSSSSAITLSGDDCGKTVVNPAAVSVNLPTGAASLIGCRILLSVVSGAMYVNPDNSSRIYPVATAGNYMTNSGASNFIELQYVTTNLWWPVGISGVWTSGN